MIPAPKPAVYSRHFYSLDVLRGLASLGIVFWHWQHFFFVGAKVGKIDTNHQPFYILFRPFYLGGARAVELFFCLSGFIFFWLYSERIAGRKTSLKEFVVLRFSRLYPLHLVTLLLVVAGQLVMVNWFGSFFVYPNNDFYHFILQLFFASNWGFERGPSFNGPVWSVSVEILLYAIFFAVCFLRLNRWWHLVLLAGLGSILPRLGLAEMSTGMFCFFMGGLAYLTFLHVWRRGLSRSFVLCLIFFTTLIWIAIPLNLERNSLYGMYRESFWRSYVLIHHKDAVGYFLIELTQNSCDLILFPVTLLTLAACEAFRGTLGKRLAFLGNISYSTYLIHFPLQLLFAMIARAFSLSSAVFYSPWVLICFFCILISLSLASYHFLERPAQKLLRDKLLQRASAKRDKALVPHRVPENFQRQELS